MEKKTISVQKTKEITRIVWKLKNTVQDVIKKRLIKRKNSLKNIESVIGTLFLL